jgi:hypothetical protein
MRARAQKPQFPPVDPPIGGMPRQSARSGDGVDPDDDSGDEPVRLAYPRGAMREKEQREFIMSLPPNPDTTVAPQFQGHPVELTLMLDHSVKVLEGHVIGADREEGTGTIRLIPQPYTLGVPTFQVPYRGQDRLFIKKIRMSSTASDVDEDLRRLQLYLAGRFW